MRVEIIWRCSLVMTVAMLSLVSCSSNDGEQEKPFTVCPVEQTKFFVCEASGETRGATAVIDTYYNIANAYAYLLKDREQAESYYRQFLDLARKEEKPTDKLKEMINAAEDMIKAFDLAKKLSLQNQQ